MWFTVYTTSTLFYSWMLPVKYWKIRVPGEEVYSNLCFVDLKGYMTVEIQCLQLDQILSQVSTI